jgi:hypothetical protein
MNLETLSLKEEKQDVSVMQKQKRQPLEVAPLQTIERPTRRKRRKCLRGGHKVTAWFRKRTSSIDGGIKTKGTKPHPVHLNRKTEIIGAYNNKDWKLLNRISNRDFGKHFTGQETFYFTATGQLSVAETLAMIDIDCHLYGSLEGAIAFVEYLKKHFYPDLYWETSTNGNGIHAYVLIEKRGVGDVLLNQAFDRLQAFLRKVLASTTFDVEGVEVKGHCPVIGWAERRGEISTITLGQLAKFPREACYRFLELQKTSRLDCWDLMKLPIPERQPGARTGQRPPASISGCFLSSDEVAKTKTSYLRLARLLHDHHRLETSSKAVVEAEDISIFFMFMVFFSNNMNADGSLPWARFKNFWDAVYKSGDIDRPFHPNRFAAIRNYLSSLGLIEWMDNRYKVGKLGTDGRKYGGQACKWKASQLLLNLIRKVEGDEEGAAIPQAKAEDGGIERASLSTTNISEEIKKLSRTPYVEIIQPQEIHDPPPLILTADDIGEYLTPFEEIWTVAI